VVLALEASRRRPPLPLFRRPLQRRLARRDRTPLSLARAHERDRRRNRDDEADGTSRQRADDAPLPDAGRPAAPDPASSRDPAARSVRGVLARPLGAHLRLRQPRLRRQQDRERAGDGADGGARFVHPERRVVPRSRSAERVSVAPRRVETGPQLQLVPPPERVSRLWLAALGALSAAPLLYHWLQSLGHVTPAIFTDELLFSELARSFAAGDGFLVRGEHVFFPAFLPALLQAPAWLAGSTPAAYAVAKGVNTAVMCSAALPAY